MTLLITPDISRTLPTKRKGLLPYAFPTFNPIQAAVLEDVPEDHHLILAVPTGAGKTVASELLAHKVLQQQGGRVAYLSPLRAVSQERFDDWTSSKHPFSRFNVQISTGDHQLSKAKQAQLAEAQILVLTAEMLDNLSRNRPQVLEGIEVLIADEGQLLGSPGRGDSLEAALMRFTEQNAHCRIAMLSATVPNVEELGGWLEHLTDVPVAIVSSDWRPTPLKIHYLPHEVVQGRSSYHMTEQRKIDAALAVMKQHPKDKFLVFGHTRASVRGMYEACNEEGYAAAIHHAGLDRDSRLDVEERFRAKGLDVVVATSTLSQGINLPARRVIILGVSRGRARVTNGDLLQECGRAGRPGLDTQGDAYILYPETEKWNGTPLIPEPVRSQMTEEAALRTHVVAEVHLGRSTPLSVVQWMDRSLARYQRAPDLASIEQVEVFLDQLVQARILAREDGAYETTTLGRVATWLYFDPLQVSDWYRNWRQLVQRDLTRDDRALAWMLASTIAGQQIYSRPEHADIVLDHEHDALSLGLRYYNRGSPTLGAAVFASLRDTGDLRDVRGQFLVDVGRWVRAVGLLDRQLAHSDEPSQYWPILEQRLRYNLPNWELADLCRLPGIGPVRAVKLYDAGIRSARAFVQEPRRAKHALGLSLHRKVLTALQGRLRGKR